MLIPATWRMALKGSRPAEVKTTPPSGIDPCFANSLKGPVPPRLLIAPETPLRQQQQPRDDIPVPGVDDHDHILVEEIALDDVEVHVALP
jgi:hypothetical protein